MDKLPPNTTYCIVPGEIKEAAGGGMLTPHDLEALYALMKLKVLRMRSIKGGSLQHLNDLATAYRTALGLQSTNGLRVRDHRDIALLLRKQSLFELLKHGERKWMNWKEVMDRTNWPELRDVFDLLDIRSVLMSLPSPEPLWQSQHVHTNTTYLPPPHLPATIRTNRSRSSSTTMGFQWMT